MNLLLNTIKSQGRYDKTTIISLQALVCVLCHLVNTAVRFLKKVVAGAGSCLTSQHTLAPLEFLMRKYLLWSWG